MRHQWRRETGRTTRDTRPNRRGDMRPRWRSDMRPRWRSDIRPRWRGDMRHIGEAVTWDLGEGVTWNNTNKQVSNTSSVTYRRAPSSNWQQLCRKVWRSGEERHYWRKEWWLMHTETTDVDVLLHFKCQTIHMGSQDHTESNRNKWG